MSESASFGDWIRRRRRALDLTREALAQQVGCAVVTIRKIETDERRPSRQVAERLAECLQIPADERVAFLQAARGELAVDRLASPLPPAGAAQPSHLSIELAPPTEPGVAAPTATPVPRGTVTFLVTDIESSTRLWEQYPQAMPAALARHDTLLRAAIESHNGVVVKTTGDGVLAVFAQPGDALAAAVSAQGELTAVTWGAVEAIRVRMALHSGVADPSTGDYAGPTLNRSTRLLAAGHGGQILLSLATTQLVRDELPLGAELRDLGTHRLKDITRPEHIFQLVAPDLTAGFPPMRTLDHHPSNLPAQVTPLVGREQEVASVCALLHRPDIRLVTLIGPGGVGKTRLALRVADELLDEFADGVFQAPLAPISSAEFLAPTIANAIQFSLHGSDDPGAQLLNYLRAKEVLLVLDNFEHLLTGIPLLVDLLGQAPRVTMLVTSRERLNLAGEWVFELEGLPFPAANRTEGLEEYGAVQLFLQSAGRARSGFSLAAETAPSVVRICQQMRGLPLGVELAAAWTRVLSCSQIAQEIDRNLFSLSASQRDVPARHRSLRAVFDHSWQLLSDEERQLFRRLSIFRGGFTLEAAEAIASELRIENEKLKNGRPCAPVLNSEFSILNLLVALIDKSLVRQDIAGRHEMHELVQQYAAAKLREVPEEHTAAHERHCGYYMALLHEREDALKTAEGPAIVAALTAEIDNLRAAWDWAIAHSAGGAALKQAQFGLWYLYDAHTWHQEGAAMFGRAAEGLAAGGETNAGLDAEGEIVRGQMLAHQGWFDMCRGWFEQARAVLKQSIALLRRHDAEAELADPLRYLGTVALHTGQYEEATGLLQESLERYQAIDNRWGSANCTGFLGQIAYYQGNYHEAQQLLQAAVAMLQALGEQYWQPTFLSYLGNVHAALGQYAKAQRLLRESMALSSATGDRWTSGLALYHLGTLNEVLEEYATARRHLQESLAIFKAFDDPRRTATTLYHLGNVTCALALDHEAWRYFAEALRLAIDAQIPPVALDALSGLAALLVKAGEVGRALDALDAIQRHPATGRPARERAQRLRTELVPLAPAPLTAEEHLIKSFKAVVEELLESKQF